jgi:SAM-dependent methyltransferase
MSELSALTQRHAAVWSNGPFEEIEASIADVHTAVVEALRPQPGERWLDLGCGAGAVAELAAGAGAQVMGIDLSPRLIDVARARAAAGNFDIEYAVGDCQDLIGVADASFDVVSSSVGVMFAPDHAATARELARVTRRGGRIGLAAWTLEGGVGELFRIMAPYQSPPPAGVGSPFAWGNPEQVQALLGEEFALSFEERVSTHYDSSGQSYWELFVTAYGPTKSLFESLDPERQAALAKDWAEFFDANYAGEDGTITHPREYTLVTGIRR